MKRLVPLIVLACVTLAAVGVAAFKGDGLPRSFVVTLSADLTSSGASRSYAGILDADGARMDGTGRYESVREERAEFACTLTDGTWSDVSAGPCLIPLDIPATRAELAAAINEGSILPSDRCGHRQLCYDIATRYTRPMTPNPAP